MGSESCANGGTPSIPSSTYDRRPTVIGGRYLRCFVAAILASLLLQVTIVTDTVIVGRLLGQVP